MLKIHGVPFSAHTRKVIVAAIEKGIPYEIVPVIPLTPPPGWTELSALGLIPSHPGRRLHAGRFLGRSASTSIAPIPALSLYPGDARQFARVLWIEEFVDGGWRRMCCAACSCSACSRRSSWARRRTRH